MASILTNASALTALRNLANTQNSLSKTQSQISTGLKVASAADNTTNWSVSTQMKTDNSVIKTIQDRLKQNGDLVNTASGALDALVTTVDKIKIERSFISSISKVDTSRRIVQSIITLGRGLGMDIVAEGVETEIEAVMMTRFGCTELQGYYFSKPLEADQMAQFLQAFEAKPIVGEGRAVTTS